jgi:phosphoenolpyruvate-protein kinase (PTS system EI component)
MGVRDLSMNPFYAARVCRVLRQLNLEQMEVALRDALSVTTPQVVQQIVSSLLRGTEV